MNPTLRFEIMEILKVAHLQEQAKSYGRAMGRKDFMHGQRTCEYCKCNVEVVFPCPQCGAPDRNKYGEGRGYCHGS